MEEEKSKSQKKREADALQNLGIEIAKLKKEQWAKIPMPEELARAVNDYRNMRSNGARDRHGQYIGRIMRKLEDPAEIEQAYAELMKGEAASNKRFYLGEEWRSRLMSEGNEALTIFLKAYPYEDVQGLRQLIRQAIHERDKQQNQGSAKALFRLIMSII